MEGEKRVLFLRSRKKVRAMIAIGWLLKLFLRARTSPVAVRCLFNEVQRRSTSRIVVI